MCIIVCKKAGIQMPDRQILKNCFNYNSDGVGIMWNKDGEVHIRKGFMTWNSFDSYLSELENQIDINKSAVCTHFRIKTHGKTSPQNCHGFCISNRVKDLKLLELTTDIGVMHNGIIPIKPIRNLSDTQTYILKQLYNIKKASPDFLENKCTMSQIENEIGSKMAFLTSDGSIYTIGKFVEQEGVLYSNKSFEERFLYSYNWLKYDDFWSSVSSKKDAQDEYIENLKIVAAFQGIDSSLVDELLNNGFTLQEIEDYIYEY